MSAVQYRRSVSMASEGQRPALTLTGRLTRLHGCCRELAQVSGGREMLPIPAFPAADWAGPSSPVRAFVEGLREDPARLDGLQRSVYSWSLGMKRWLALRVKSAMTGHGTEW